MMSDYDDSAVHEEFSEAALPSAALIAEADSSALRIGLQLIPEPSSGVLFAFHQGTLSFEFFFTGH